MNDLELRRFLLAFHAWHEKAIGMQQRCSRTRMLFLCLLMRHTGMRLGEAIAFRDCGDLDAGSCSAFVRGAHERMVPLPPHAASKLAELRDAPAVVRDKDVLCRFDPGYVRRVFEARGREAGLPFRMNPSLLRLVREEELRRMGLEDRAVRYLMGRGGSLGEAAMLALRQAFREREEARSVGKHNCFFGEIEDLERGVFCTRVKMRTDSGLLLNIRCTSRTAARLELEPGSRARASFRSLKGRLAMHSEGENSFLGRITAVYAEGGERKVLLELDGGEKCCVIADGAQPSGDLEAGREVWLRIGETDLDISADT